MTIFHLDELLAEGITGDFPYLEFLNKPSLSAGLYVLPAGGVDRQKPHSKDEIYYVISGQGVINIEGDDRPVKGGDIVFVEAGREHFFHIITDDLKLLVVFGQFYGSANN